MKITSLLKELYPQKGFVYDDAKLDDGTMTVSIRPRRGSKALCSQCGKPGPTYDTQRERLYQFVPLWGLIVFFAYALRPS